MNICLADYTSIHGVFTSDGQRTALTLNGIYNGNFVNNGLGTGNYTFAAYPYNGGAMLLETDNGGSNALGISGENMYVQTATSISTTQGYGLNLSGINGNGEVDLISEFSTNNTMAGLYDVNNFGWTMSGFNLGTGNYSVNSNGRGTISFPELQTSGNSMIGALNLAFYVVDNSTSVFVETVRPGSIFTVSHPSSRKSGHSKSESSGAASSTANEARGAHLFAANPTAK